MKTIVIFFISIVVSGCSVIRYKEDNKSLSLAQLEEEQWYFCNRDSVWTYDDQCNPITDIDYKQVRKLKVGNILKVVYFEGIYIDLHCAETDSVIPGRTVRLTTSKLANMAIPIDSFPNLQVLDLSNNHFFQFPFEIFFIPKLTAINIDNMCLHDYCEPCLYRDESCIIREGNSYHLDTSYYNQYYKTDFRPYHIELRKLKQIYGWYECHPESVALIDSINKSNKIEKYDHLFNDYYQPCGYKEYSDDPQMEVEQIWK